MTLPVPALELISEHACFGGVQRFYRHASTAIGLPMRFSVYLPPQALAGEKCPALFFLAGLTCTEETFAIKAGAQRVAAREGLILIAPDTSPRGANVPGETAAGISASVPASTWTLPRRPGASTTAWRATSPRSCITSRGWRFRWPLGASVSSGTRWAATAR